MIARLGSLRFGVLVLGAAFALVVGGGIATIGDEGTTSMASGDPADECLTHSPIDITEDAGPNGFVLQAGTPTYRPGSGVTGGSGTAEDPFIIEGWCIDGAETVKASEDGIRLVGTQAHVLIKANAITAMPGIGILVEDAENVTIEASTIAGNEEQGVLFDGSNNVSLEDSLLTGNVEDPTYLDPEGNVELQSVEDSLIAGNEISDSHARGLLADGSTGNTFENNLVTRHKRGEESGNGREGVLLRNGGENVFQDNTVGDNDDGLVSRGENNRFARNTFENNHGVAAALRGDGAAFVWNTVVDTQNTEDVCCSDGTGLRVQGQEGGRIANNTVTGSAAEGLYLLGVYDTVIENNTVADNDDTGIGTFGGASGNVIQDNVLENNALSAIAFKCRSSIDDNLVQHNLIRKNGAGIFVECGHPGTVIEANVVADNGVGISLANRDVSFAPDCPHEYTDIVANNIEGNEAGVGVGSDVVLDPDCTGEQANVVGNWWGAASGPHVEDEDGDAVEDDCSGETTSGIGDVLLVVDGLVCYTPWLEEPNVNAGPRG